VTRLVIIGATGRMGGALLRLLPRFPQLQLQSATAGPASAGLGQDSGELHGLPANGVRIRADLESALEGAGLAISFSAAQPAVRQVGACVATRVPLLLGTTGLGPEARTALAEAARTIPLLVAANTSLGIAVLEELVRRAAAALPADFDVRIQDTHHRAKIDAPSGTALSLGAAVEQGRGKANPVGYAALRGGDVIGEHEVHFLGLGERLSLRHSATDRAIFARGALQAGLWLAGQPAGAYRMADVHGEI
jgi:4-hydroxy-tetrahydrodipicolinate reductase